MQVKEVLQKIGLTESESKVYLSLLHLGPSSKGAIVKDSQIASSKIYETLDKLESKGLVSVVIKENVKVFSPASPHKITEFLQQKELALQSEKSAFLKILPSMLERAPINKPKIEVYQGWEGLETAYMSVLHRLKQNEEVQILGASSFGSAEERAQRFFAKYNNISQKKHLRMQVIFNKGYKKYVEQSEMLIGRKYNKKYIDGSTDTELTITEECTIMLMKSEEPTVLLITDIGTAQSYRTYFKHLWTSLN